MKTIPKSRQQIEDERLLKVGTYSFTVRKAEDTLSKAGNETIKLQLDVFRDDGEIRTVFDYLNDKVPEKVLDAVEALGLEKFYNKGELSAWMFEAKSGYVAVSRAPAKDGFPAKNVVQNYLPARPALGSAEAKAAHQEALQDDEIPF